VGMGMLRIESGPLPLQLYWVSQQGAPYNSMAREFQPAPTHNLAPISILRGLSFTSSLTLLIKTPNGVVQPYRDQARVGFRTL
jgi:hypothetical protein